MSLLDMSVILRSRVLGSCHISADGTLDMGSLTGEAAGTFKLKALIYWV